MRGSLEGSRGDRVVVHDDAAPALHHYRGLNYGQSVTDVAWQRSGTIRLTFDDGTTLVIEDDSPHYESYQIVHGNLQITV